MATRKKAAKKAAAKKASAKKAPVRTPVGPSARERGVTVASYVASLRDWRGETISALRRLIREASPDAVESIKWGQPVYEAQGPFAYIKAYKSHVNFGFWRGAELTDPKGILQGSGSRMRHVELRSPADIDTATLQGMVRTAVELNRIKGDPAKRR
ncbi:MAG: DUF1801 domain-containing protein [Hyalangium sp.]|uniref:DUF1801 domain-containing protein n=1 Tax=Hyalangium sp. TaxID=2028555 RepID=UPI003899B5D5